MKVLIAVPCLDYVSADFTRCLMELQKPAGTGFAMVTNTLVYTSRTIIAQNAINAGFDRVLWIDSDMVFPDDILIKLSADMDEGRDLVSALCFTRREPSVPCIQSDLTWEVKPDGWVETNAYVYMDYPRDQVFEIAGCGFGCVMTSIDLLKRMVEDYGAPFYPLMGMGEDTTFCFRAGKAGIKMYCDSRVKVGHIGKKVFDENDYFGYRNPV